MPHDLLTGEPADLVRRGITRKTCERYGYLIGEDAEGNGVHIANYRDLAGRLHGQKVRGPDKTFWTVGDMNKRTAPLFGMHQFRDGGKRVMVTEGEIDALSLGQVFPTWPVVSIPLGAGSAADSFRANVEWLEKFDEVVLCFDMDDAGRKAALDAAAVLTPGRAKLWSIPLKDASDMLQADRVKELSTAVYEAKTFRPGGIKNGRELWDAFVNTATEFGTPYPWAPLTEKMRGYPARGIVTVVSGTGMGKSTLVSAIGYDALMAGKSVAHIALEEGVGQTVGRYVGRSLGRRLELEELNAEAAEALRPAFDALPLDRWWTYDHFGSMDDESLLDKMRYLIKGCGVKVLILDHLSIVVSGMDAGDDERKTIDRLMTRLRSLVEETDTTLFLICHLKRVDGKARSHEEGGRITLGHLRGSQAIAQISDDVLAMERDQQAESKNVSLIRSLKCRISGFTGPVCYLMFNEDTGEFTVTDPPSSEGFSDDDDAPF